MFYNNFFSRLCSYNLQCMSHLDFVKLKSIKKFEKCTIIFLENNELLYIKYFFVLNTQVLRFFVLIQAFLGKHLQDIWIHKRPQFWRKQAQNARFQWLNTSVLGLFSRKRGSINSAKEEVFDIQRFKSPNQQHLAVEVKAKRKNVLQTKNV